jgi:hypothetical protein
MAKAKAKQPSGSDNLLLAVAALVVVCTVTAVACAWICSFVLSSFADSNTMALLITDAGVKSDDKNLEHQLSSATMALKTVRDIGWALGVGSLTVGVAVFIRYRRGL